MYKINMIAKCMEEILIQNEWTQKELAEKLKTTPKNISKWINKKNNPSLVFQNKIITLYQTLYPEKKEET